MLGLMLGLADCEPERLGLIDTEGLCEGEIDGDSERLKDGLIEGLTETLGL